MKLQDKPQKSEFWQFLEQSSIYVTPSCPNMISSSAAGYFEDISHAFLVGLQFRRPALVNLLPNEQLTLPARSTTGQHVIFGLHPVK